MLQKIRHKRTAVSFAVRKTSYIPEHGSESTTELISVPYSIDKDGAAMLRTVFYCEWLGAYGSVAVTAQAQGLNFLARIRMPFIEEIFNALINDDVTIYKDAIIDDNHAFKLSSSPNNYLEFNKMIEFNVSKIDVR